MMCSDPFVRLPTGITKKKVILSGALERASPFPCGQCLNCRINQARIWTHRILLEMCCHDKSCFVTLTYEELPKGGELNRTDLRNYLKRLRKRIAPRKIRFFGCGEYGSQSYRPHFHICLFGLGAEDEKDITAAWTKKGEPIGIVHIGEVNKDSARYITGYILKKNTDRDDQMIQKMEREFATMSTKPGIGFFFINRMKEQLSENEWYDNQVFKTLSYSNKEMPLGRYLSGKLNHGTGQDDNIDYINTNYLMDQVWKGLDISEEEEISYYEGIKKVDRQKRRNQLVNQKLKRKRSKI